MAEKSIADSRHHLPIDTYPQPILKDIHGSDNTLPLLPQWLQPKPGDTKMGIENNASSQHVEQTSSLKGPGNGEALHEAEKRKDIFKLALHDSETGTRDRWRDEERETSSAIRRDHRAERWPDNSMRHSGERRNSSDRWSESGNRESSFDQRRGSKWNSRWGPDDKESESSKNGEVPEEKMATRLPSHGRDVDKEGEVHSRSWRSNSSMSRGKTDPSYQHPLTPHKQTMLGYGRGKWENGAPLSPSGRGNFGFSHTNTGTSRPYHSGALSFKSGVHTGSSLLRYGRMKLLDIYRATDFRSHRVSVDEITEVPSLTQSEPLEPLALSAPSIDELVIMKAIEKGEVASSGVSSKEGRNTVDPVMSKQIKLGIHEDLPHVGGDCKIEGSGSTKLYDGRNPEIEPAPWRSQSEDISRWSSDLKDNPTSIGTRSSEVNWSRLTEDAENETRSTFSSSLCRDDSSWQNDQFVHVENENNPKIARNNFPTRNFEPNLSPEELSLCYKDPYGQVQGPFSGSDLIGWFEAGYFGIDLEVRPANAPSNAPFLLLGDVIPQLKLKFRPPPGFCATNANEIQGMSIKEKSGSIALGTYSSIGHEPSKSMKRHGNLVPTETDNQVSESLISTNLRSSVVESSSEGTHSRGINGPGYSPSLVEVGNGVNYLLAQKMLLEKQHDSLPNTLPSLSWIDSSPMSAHMAAISNLSEPHSKFIPHTVDPTYQAFQASQKFDLLSLVQAGQAGTPSSMAVSSGAAAWANHPDAQALNNSGHTGLDIPQNKMGVNQNQHHGSQFGFVVPPPTQQPHNILSHLVNRPANLSGMLSPEQFRSSDVTQDAQMLNMLAQHYLLSQPPIQPQVGLPSQFSLLNECLLLKQQLQQQQQQQLLLQQQFFLSQVLSGHQSSQRISEPPQKLQSSFPEGKDVPTDHLLHLQGQEAYINQMILSDNLHDGHNSTIENVNLQDSNNIYNSSSSSGPSLLHLPHQISASFSKKHESNQNDEDNRGPDLLLKSGIVGTSAISDALEKSVENFSCSNVLEKCHEEKTRPSMPHPELASSQCPVLLQEVSSTSGLVFTIADQIHDVKISSDDNTVVQHNNDVSAIKCSKNLETSQTKKAAEKKARKKKNAKPQLALELLRGFSVTNQPDQTKSKLEFEDVNPHVLPEAHMDILNPHDFVFAAVDDNDSTSPYKATDSQISHLPPGTNTSNEVKNSNRKAECIDSGISESSCLRAWKSAPGIRAKSLKEIQQEEQQRVQMERMASDIEINPSICPVSVPWAETISGTDHKSKSGRDSLQLDSCTEYISQYDSNLNLRSRKSHLHDLLAEEVLAQSGETDANFSKNSQGQLLQPVLAPMTLVDASNNDEDFVEAKDTKKSRKKASKAKVTGATNPSTIGLFDLSSPIASEKRKSQNQARNDNEVLPAPLAAPSLADFVCWKEEPINSSQLSAWPIDMGKHHKPTSLRDIQKEQENKLSAHQNIPIPTLAKAQSNRGNNGSGSWQVPRSSPSSGTSPIQSNTLTSRQLKPKIEDDLFWGPVDQSKQQAEQCSFPALANSNWGAKSPARAIPAPTNWHKSHSPSSASGLAASRGKKDDAPSNLSEAMGFRDWCEKELIKLTGTNDTSFLEYCLKQPNTETEMLLKENLGSLDRNHEFIDKFLSYKDLLPSKVIEMAFRAGSSAASAAAVDFADRDAEAGKGGKKKGKKGKKVSSTVLGFSVASNRIMMGDIQTVEE